MDVFGGNKGSAFEVGNEFYSLESIRAEIDGLTEKEVMKICLQNIHTTYLTE